ncbi:lysozyme [Methylobacterium sp. HMF5984]|uniref:lysozyme n=1 Tax=Methylobacterium sp. HMF5984 TaxID=3367370 RepID=UPI003854C865
MNLTPIGEACLIAREGRRLTAYRDSVGVWTIGVGHTSAAGRPRVVSGLAITAAECDAIFARDVAAYVAAVRDGLTAAVGPHAFDALVSLCYNIGPAAFAGSTVLRRINAGDAAGAADALLLWRKPAAILPRRRAEAEQLVTAYAVALPRPTVNAARLRIAAPVAAVTDPGVATPVLVPTVPRPGRLARLRHRIEAWLAAAAAPAKARA